MSERILTRDVWDGIMLRHRLVEEAEDKMQVAEGQAYLCHLDRADLLDSQAADKERIAALERALEPFAEAADRVTWGGTKFRYLTVRQEHCAVARAALQATPPQEGDG